MAMHDYTPEQALNILMKRLSDADETLAALVQEAIDEGKVISEDPKTPIEDEVAPRYIEFRESRSLRRRQYWRSVPYTYSEAFQFALGVLRAYFIQQPLLQNDIVRNFGGHIVKRDDSERQQELWEDSVQEYASDDMILQISIRTDTQIESIDEDAYGVEVISNELIEEQERNIDKLSELTNFEES